MIVGASILHLAVLCQYGYHNAFGVHSGNVNNCFFSALFFSWLPSKETDAFCAPSLKFKF